MEKVILSDTQLFVHPRGFVGTEFIPGVRPMDTLELRERRRTPHPKVDFAKLAEIPGDEEIIKIRKMFEMSPTDRYSLQLIDKLVVFANRKIGTRNFNEWVRAQAASPCTVNAHMEFLDETLAYICGQRRRTSFTTYRLCIAAGDKKTNGVQLKNDSLLFIEANEPKITRVAGGICPVTMCEPVLTEEVIQLWISREGGTGIKDLLYTMELMYGPVTN